MNQTLVDINSSEGRGAERFEPAELDAEVKSIDKTKSVNAKVLDASRSGMAVAFYCDNPFVLSDQVEICLKKTDTSTKRIKNGGAVVRNWEKSRFGGVRKGFAIEFTSEISEKEREYDKLLFDGVRQKARIANQFEIAKSDIEYLGAYRQKLIDCQLRLFFVILTLGVALGSAYFGLSYHSVITTNQNNAGELSFWRAMLALMPALLAIACGFMCIQKSVSIQRIDSFLSILKERVVKFQYPREYLGWETAIRKYRHIFNTERCEKCWIEPKCGNPTNADKEGAKNKGLLQFPFVAFYHLIIYSAFLFVYLVSVAVILVEIVKHGWGTTTNMALTGVIVLFSVLLIGGFRKIFIYIRKGKFSFEQFKCNWRDILNNCKETV